MTETQRPQHEREEVKVAQVTKFLQCLDDVLTENRNIFTVLPELHKRFVELEANMTKGAATAAPDNTGNTGELSGNRNELKDKREHWQTQQAKMEKQITRLIKDLNEANQKISELETKNKQNDKDVEMLKGETRAKPDKNYYQSKCKDLKAKLRTINEDLKTKQEKIAELGRELCSRQEDYDKEIQRYRAELAERERALAKQKEELAMVKQEHDEFSRDKKAKLDEFETRIAEFERDALLKQEDFDKETQRNKQQLTEREKANENLATELESKNHELRHYMERFKQQEEKFNSGLSLKVIEVNKLQQRLKQQEEKFISDLSLKEIEVKQLKQRLAGICEKRVKQDQRKVENILESNQQSEVENDFREFFDSDREDARDIIQSIYGSEEEIDVHVYYPRIACTIFETAYEQAFDVKEAMIDLFKEITKNVIHQAPEVVRNFRLTRTDGDFSFDSISNDDHNVSENSTADVLDALLTSLKETSHICNLDCLEKEVVQSTWEKWNEWHNENTVFIHSPSWEVLTSLNSYIKACIRLTWRMVTQLPPLKLEYQSSNFDCRIHKKTAYHDTIEKKPGNDESSEEIACYLWPGLIDGGERIIRPGDVICKMNGETFT